MIRLDTGNAADSVFYLDADLAVGFGNFWGGLGVRGGGLIKSGQVRRGRLPPVFPLVLYNGEKKWQAAQEVADLIAAPSGLARWVPCFRYHLLDEGRMPNEALRRLSNSLLACLIELETRTDNAGATLQLSGVFR